MKYRVFIGLMDSPEDQEPDMVSLDQLHDTWESAKAAMLERLYAFKGDLCFDCEQDALRAAKRLELMNGPKFSTDVDGFDYIITGAMDDE